MPLALPTRFQALESERSKTAGRYVALSMVNNVNHQGLLWLANSVWGWPGGWANLFAGTVASIPAYLLSRAWVWRVKGRQHDLRREVLPFWGIALLGLAVSTLFAQLADSWFGDGIAVNVASLVAYFLVWVLKFVLLDRLFVTSETTAACTSVV